MSYSRKVQEQFIELQARGETIRRISELLKVSPRTLQYWAEKFKEEIVTAHRTILEELLVKHGITHLGRIEKVGIQLEKVNAAIDGKNLTTERLRDLYAAQKLLLDRLKTLTYL
jgi:DNA-binding transcriptional MerR regulator